MTYMIDHRRLTKRSRPELLTLCEKLDRTLNDERARVAELTVIAERLQDQRNEARQDLELVTAQRDQAVAELDERVRECDVYRRREREATELMGKTETARVEMEMERDHYKEISARDFKKLTDAETAISERDGTIAAIRRDATVLRTRCRRWKIAAVVLGVILGAVALLACTPRSPTSPSECEGIQHCRDGMGTDTAGGVTK